MTLRERLLELLQNPDYTPANAFELARRLGMPKKQRPMLAHEIRRLLAGGEAVTVQGDRVQLRGSEG
jgi:hypothetical protein